MEVQYKIKVSHHIHIRPTVSQLTGYSIQHYVWTERFRVGGDDITDILLKVALNIINQATFSVRGVLEWYCSRLVGCLMMFGIDAVSFCAMLPLSIDWPFLVPYIFCAKTCMLASPDERNSSQAIQNSTFSSLNSDFRNPLNNSNPPEIAQMHSFYLIWLAEIKFYMTICNCCNPFG
jgi:hypothetical protein